MCMLPIELVVYRNSHISLSYSQVPSAVLFNKMTDSPIALANMKLRLMDVKQNTDGVVHYHTCAEYNKDPKEPYVCMEDFVCCEKCPKCIPLQYCGLRMKLGPKLRHRETVNMDDFYDDFMTWKNVELPNTIVAYNLFAAEHKRTHKKRRQNDETA